MKILFAGTPDSAAIVLKNLVKAGHEVVCVLTREDAPVGRKKVLTESSVARAAKSLGIKVIKSNRLSDETIKEVVDTGAELGIVVAYGVILRRKALNALRFGWFNLHYSVLPKYRGAAPIQWAIINGEKESGLTVFKLDEGMDTGDIVLQMPMYIHAHETAGDAITRFSELGSTLLMEILPLIYSGEYKVAPQEGTASIAPKLVRSDARIDFNRNAKQVEALVRGANPEPMAWCTIDAEPLRVLAVREVPTNFGNREPGEIVLDKKVYVACGEGTYIELIEVQPSSKRVMAAADWLRGSSNIRRLT